MEQVAARSLTNQLAEDLAWLEQQARWRIGNNWRNRNMTRNDLLRRVKKRPFSPFRIVVSEGATYDVRSPEQIIVARDSVTIGIPSDSDDFYETTDVVDLFHVIRLEPLPTTKGKTKAAPEE